MQIPILRYAILNFRKEIRKMIRIKRGGRGRRGIVLMMIAALMVLAMIGFAGCGDGSGSAGDDGKIHVVATVFPEYDWVMNVIGAGNDDLGDAAGLVLDLSENIDVDLLVGNGVDMHSYQPTVEDIAKISAADLIIYVGGESDKWVDDAVSEALKSKNPDMVVLNLMEVMGDAAKEEEIVEGMEDCDEGAGNDGDLAGAEPEEVEYDEHVWLSLRNAQLFVSAIAEKLGDLDPNNAMAYRGNADVYNDELAHLDADYLDVFVLSSRSHLVFGDRFPFRYMFDDYHMEYYAAFPGCSAETEASFETVTFLAGKVDELGLKSVLTIEGNDHRLAETIVNNTTEKNQRILTLNSMQSISTADISNGVTYLKIMRDNLDVFKTALQY